MEIEGMVNEYAGILLKKLDSFEQLDKQKFENLVESGFKRKLIPGYFDYVNPNLICVAEKCDEYCGAIVVEQFGENGNKFHYLDKIVVSKEYQGNGIGKKLWEVAIQESDKLIWRAKPENPIRKFYTEKCEGMQKVKDWIIYWKGLTPEELEQGVGFALSKKATLC